MFVVVRAASVATKFAVLSVVVQVGLWSQIGPARCRNKTSAHLNVWVVRVKCVN